MQITDHRSCLKVSRQANGEPEIFLSLQGEGHSLGTTSVFLRLATCNLACSWCDTKYTWDWQNFSYKDEVAELPLVDVEQEIRTRGCRHLVITGGEPMLQQKGLVPLIESLARNKYTFEIETNGTIMPEPSLVKHIDQWNVSPKLANSGNAAHAREIPQAIDYFANLSNAYFKFVIVEQSDAKEVGNLVNKYNLPPSRVMLMPEGRTPEMLQERSLWLSSICANEGYRFTPRLHIMLWGDRRGT